MASFFPSSPALFMFFILLLVLDTCESSKKGSGGTSGADGSKQYPELDYLTLALNLEYLETEFFLCGAFGYGLDIVNRSLAMGGLPPIGCTMVQNWFNPAYQEITAQFAYQEIGHLKAIKNQIGGSGFPRPQLNISAASFATIMDTAFGKKLTPPFNPYDNFINYFIASYVIPYVGLTAYVGSAPNLQTTPVKQLVAGLLGVESGQDAVIRGILYQYKDFQVLPYTHTVAEFTNQISTLRNNLGHNGTKDEGLVVDPKLGAEGKTAGNVLAGDEHSLAYSRNPDEVLSIVYGTGNPKIPGGFFPKGADGNIAKSFH